VKILCPISTLVSAEEFCQIAAISRDTYDRDRRAGLIVRNGHIGQTDKQDRRFHNSLDVLHYALCIGLEHERMTEFLGDAQSVSEIILDRIAAIVETAKHGDERPKTILDGYSFDPFLFSVPGKVNEAIVIYRRMGEVFERVESVIGGRFPFRLSLACPIDDMTNVSAPYVWIDSSKAAAMKNVAMAGPN